MARKAIRHNTLRQLWSQCGGFCQNPSCNRYLFASIEDEVVSLANVAHVIGYGANGPRTDHELAEYIDRDGISNLIMLCLDCHKIVDELERKFTVELMREWKTKHEQRIRSLFHVPYCNNEREILMRVSDLLDENNQIFREYGPFSEKALDGSSGDTLKIWRRRCLDTILPNNQMIIDIIECNRRNFPFPWDVYREMMGYRLHSDAFRDNCLLEQRVNDYKLFPVEFDHFVKQALGLPVLPIDVRVREELEFRNNAISTIIERFLRDHSFISYLEELNSTRFYIELKDGRSLRVFVTNTYFFTEYTYDKVMAIDPEVDVIVCSCPAATYSEEAKLLCIENQIGLFMLKEFMGAIWKKDEEFLNYLLRDDQADRIRSFTLSLRSIIIPTGLSVFLFGSYLRRKVYRDIDVMLVYSDMQSKMEVEKVEQAVISVVCQEQHHKLDFTICSSSELQNLRFDYNNLTRIHNGSFASYPDGYP